MIARHLVWYILFKSHGTNRCRTVKKHLVDSDTMPPLQSAYRSGHSTETALIKVISDIINAADGQQVTLLGLLDMSATFDTVDHDILLHRLAMSYGVGHFGGSPSFWQEGPRLCMCWQDVPTMPTIVWCAAGFGPRTSLFCFLYGRCHRNRHGTWNSNPRICRRHPDLRQLRRLGSSTRCHTSLDLRIRNRILDELKSAETQGLENRIHIYIRLFKTLVDKSPLLT